MAATLEAIRTKVRRLTRSPSASSITDDQIDEYVNTFVLYDFPENLRLFSLRRTLTFYTKPNVDVYETNTTNPDDPLFDFKDKYITIHKPIFIAGYDSVLSQSREEFFAIYPILNSIQSIGTNGDGATTTFEGTLSAFPVLQRQVLFDSIDSNNNGLSMVDTPISNSIGNLSVPNEDPTSFIVQDPTNFINYVTGEFTVTFPTAPGAGQLINSQTVPYVAGLPQSMLYFDNKFTLRPVPDQPYRVDMEVFVQPTELLEFDQEPDLKEWWQYIAYGAAKKIFEDRADFESVQQIMPEFKNQERLVLRRTLVQYANERTATIYTQQTNTSGSWWGSGSGYI